jgi:tRNA pseudouridine55 synthase
MARRALGERRIGHTGTLDPMAEGLLLLCVGQCTRLQQYLMRWEKSYRGQIRLGHATTTYDSDGEPIDPRGEPRALDRSDLDELERRFTGDISQVPPPYSAKKVAGKKLYELARSGQELRVEPKTVTVHALQLELVQPDLISVNVKTSTGFYVRTLANDLGLEIGCGAYLHHLCRDVIGPYKAAEALPQSVLESAESPQEILGHSSWVPLDSVALPCPEVSLNTAATDRFHHGQEVIVFRSGSETVTTGSDVVVRGPNRRLLGIGQVQAVLARGRTVSLRPVAVLQDIPTEPPVASGGSS